MQDFRLARDLAAAGLSPDAIQGQLARGTLLRVRRGAYSLGREGDPVRAHRRLLESTLAQGHPGAVVSHGSAAVLHELPVPRSALRRAHLTRNRSSGGQRRTWVQVHAHRLEPVDVVEIDSHLVTGLARTVVDLACVLPLRDAVAVGDAALRRGASAADLGGALGRIGPRHGVASARRALDLLDARSESYGESVSRVVLIDNGLAPTELQLDVCDRRGAFVGRTDFAWPELGVLGEFDGRVKYGRTLGAGRDLPDVLWDEKLREDLLRDLGWQVVRWIWADLDDPTAWFERLRRAGERGHDMRPALADAPPTVARP